MVNVMGMENVTLMVIYTMEMLKIMNVMVKEYIIILKHYANIKDNLKMVIKMGMENIYLADYVKIGVYLSKGNLKMAKEMDNSHIITLMEQY